MRPLPNAPQAFFERSFGYTKEAGQIFTIQPPNPTGANINTPF